MDQDALNQTSSVILESVYCTCLAYELRARGLAVETEKVLPVYYEGLRLDGGYRIDLLVEDSVVTKNLQCQLLSSSVKSAPRRPMSRNFW